MKRASLWFFSGSGLLIETPRVNWCKASKTTGLVPEWCTKQCNRIWATMPSGTKANWEHRKAANTTSKADFSAKRVGEGHLSYVSVTLVGQNCKHFLYFPLKILSGTAGNWEWEEDERRKAASKASGRRSTKKSDSHRFLFFIWPKSDYCLALSVSQSLNH